ncbi:hypothetical protein D3C73_657120 [compost metagenome]
METPKLKRCKQCGEVKAQDMFRPYYGQSSTSRYKLCLTCEKVNNRLKYLRKKPNPSQEDTVEIGSIEKLYTLQRSRGLKPPGTKDIVRAEMSTLLEEELFKQQELLAAESSSKFWSDTGTSALISAQDGSTVEVPIQALYPDNGTPDNVPVDQPRSIPAPLAAWLNADLTEFEPEYLQDEVASHLLETYKPQIGADPLTFKPIYDEQYRDILQDIFKRFDEYEETVYEND